MSRTNSEVQPKDQSSFELPNLTQQELLLNRNHPEQPAIAVIGAGMAGAIAGRSLADNGCKVRIFEQARGAGGRMAWRREGGYEFDHGAQYFSVRDLRLKHYVDYWMRAGLVSTWQPALAVVKNGELSPKPANGSLYVGTPGMNAAIRHLLTNLDVLFSTPVVSIQKNHDTNQWRVTTEAGTEKNQYDGVIVAIPPAQAASLLQKPAPSLTEAIKKVHLAPCWALMVAFAETLPISFDGLFLENSPLAWTARNTSKPWRPNAECWVLHGTAEWSRSHLKDNPSQVANALLSAFFAAVNLKPLPPLFVKAHRWRSALVENPLASGHLWDPELTIGCCGDWCQSSRVEGAFLSGLTLAEHMVASMTSQ